MFGTYGAGLPFLHVACNWSVLLSIRRLPLAPTGQLCDLGWHVIADHCWPAQAIFCQNKSDEKQVLHSCVARIGKREWPTIGLH